MDLHIYTRELLEKHLLPELKEIAQCFSLIPEGNKTRRETWVAALVGKPFPVFQSIAPEESAEKSLEVDPVEEPLMEAVETSPGVEVDPVEEPLMETVKTSAVSDWRLEITPLLEKDGLIECFNCEEGFVTDRWGDIVECPRCDGSQWAKIDRTSTISENSPGSESVQATGEVQRQEPLMEAVETSPGVDRVQEPIEFLDLESALAEIARLRTQNDKLLELARSQSEAIRRAKDISPVEKPNLKRVLALARAAFLDVFKSTEGNWILSMGNLRRSFKKLRDIWELLILDDWYLEDLFSPPPPQVVPKPLFAPIHSKYSAVPFCDDDLIDIWSLGVNAASSGRSPPAGGEAM